MRTGKLNYFAVGLFVLLALIALIVSIALLTGRTGASDAYHAYYSNVTGVKFGTQVVYEGYPIGQVTDVEPEVQDGRMRFRITFDVTEGWQIPDDSVVAIAAPGLLAAVTLAIQAGESATALSPGAEVTAQERSDVFSVVADVAGDFGDLSENFIKPLLGNVNIAVSEVNALLSDGGDGQLIVEDAREVIGITRQLMIDMEDRIPTIAERLESIFGEANVTTRRLNTILSEGNQDKIVAMIDNLNGATQKFDQVLINMNSILQDIDDLTFDEEGDLARTLEETRYIAESVARNIDSLNQNMDGAARNLFEFSRQIRQNPGVLLGGSAPADQGAVQ